MVRNGTSNNIGAALARVVRWLSAYFLVPNSRSRLKRNCRNQQLFAFLVLGHERRRLLWFAVTRNPTAEWLARQITEAFPWYSAPKYLIRDNDRAFGVAFKARVRAMGIRDRPTSYRSPWQNGYVERLIGSIRRECTDHLIVLNAEHLRRILAKDATYYMRRELTFRSQRTRRADGQSNDTETLSRIRGGLHYRYARI